MTTLGNGECEINLGEVASSRDTFDEAFSKISGRSNEYNLITEPVGFEFSDLIGEGIRGAAEENSTAWRGSMNACILAFGVLEQVHSAVDTYNTTYDEIEERYNAYVQSVGDTLPTNYGNIIESYHQEARDAWDAMEKECGEAEEKLKGGATPENIRELADAGHFGAHGQIGFYINDDVNYYNVDGADAETLAVQLEEAVMNGRDGSIEILEGGDVYLALLNNIAARAGVAERKNEDLLDGEIEFLETLYGELGNIEGADGFLGFVGEIQESDHIDDELRGRIQESLGNGTLTLSNESVGGGVEYLPQDVQDAASGPEEASHAPGAKGEATLYNEWVPGFERLSTILGSSNDGVSGGTEFSTQLLATSSQAITDIESTGLLEDQRTSDSTFQNIIDAASRNEEASHIIITGEDFSGEEYQHHEKHEEVTPETALKNLYGYDWDDNGAAVSGITDWISEEAWHDSNEEEVPEHLDLREQAVNAAMELVSVLGTEDVYKELSGVGEMDITDDDFDPDDLELSFTALNPEIASSMAGIYESYIDGFAGQQGMAGGEIEWDSLAGGVPNNGGFEATPADRVIFMEYLIGDDRSAERAVIATEAYNDAQIHNFFTGDPGQYPEKAATLQILLDRGFENEQMSREAKIDDEVERKEQIYSTVASMGSAAIGEVPYLGTALSEGASWASEQYIDQIFDDFSVGANGATYTDNTSVENKVATQALDVILREDRDSLSSGTLEGLVDDGFLSVEEGEYFVTSPESWPDGSGSNSRNTGLQTVLSEIGVGWERSSEAADYENVWEMVAGQEGFASDFRTLYLDHENMHERNEHPHLPNGSN